MPKGVKECPECHAQVGNRAQACKCGYAFVKKTEGAPAAKPATKSAPAPAPVAKVKLRSPRGDGVICIPGVGPGEKAKLCPVPLTGKDRDTVRKWIEDLQDHVGQRGNQYGITAILYMVNIFYPIYPTGTLGVNPEYTEVCDLVKDLMFVEPDEEVEETAEIA